MSHVTDRFLRHSFPLAFLAFATIASAMDVKHPSGFSIWIPDGWSTETDKEGNLMASDPNEEVLLLFFEPESVESIEKDLTALEKELSPYIQNVNLGEPEEDQVNGLDVMFAEGTGQAEGEAVEIGVGVYHKAGNALVVCGSIDSDSPDIEATLDKILQSVKR